KGEHGEMWLGTEDGLSIFNPNKKDFLTLKAKDISGFKGTTILPVFIDTIKKKAWLMNDTAMYEMNTGSRKCKQVIFRDSLNKQIFPRISGIPVHYKTGCLISASYNNQE